MSNDSREVHVRHHACMHCAIEQLLPWLSAAQHSPRPAQPTVACMKAGSISSLGRSGTWQGRGGRHVEPRSVCWSRPASEQQA